MFPGRFPFFGSVLLLSLAALLTGCDEPRAVQVPLGEENLVGLYWEPKDRLSPGVLLLPMLGHSNEEWIPFANRLRRQGFAVLAVEFREGGRTDRDRLLADVRAGFTFLREQKKVDAARIGLVGASLGANAALTFAAQEPLARLAVLLSPGLDLRGLTSLPALRDYGVRPLLLLAAEEDLGAAAAVRHLAEEAQGETRLKISPGVAHGSDLLHVGGPLADDIIAFLHAHL